MHAFWQIAGGVITGLLLCAGCAVFIAAWLLPVRACSMCDGDKPDCVLCGGRGRL